VTSFNPKNHTKTKFNNPLVLATFGSNEHKAREIRQKKEYKMRQCGALTKWWFFRCTENYISWIRPNSMKTYWMMEPENMEHQGLRRENDTQVYCRRYKSGVRKNELWVIEACQKHVDFLTCVLMLWPIGCEKHQLTSTTERKLTKEQRRIVFERVFAEAQSSLYKQHPNNSENRVSLHWFV